jgi:uncharacterized membrane protein YjdF
MPPGRAIGALARRQPAPFAALGVTVSIFVISSLARSDGRLWAFLVVVAVVVAAVAIADATARFSTRLLWALTALAGAHLAGGLLPSPSGAPTFYETWIVSGLLKYDQAVHFAGSALATAVAWQLLGRYLDPTRASAVVQAQLAAAIALGKGALNEVIEFIASVAGQHVIIGDGANTGWDLVFNLGGVVAAAVWLVGSEAPRSTAVSADEVGQRVAPGAHALDEAGVPARRHG